MPDFADIAGRSTLPRRRRGSVIPWIAGLAVLGIVAFLAIELQEEQRVNQAMLAVAVEAPAPQVASAPVASALPPLVMLEDVPTPAIVPKTAPVPRKVMEKVKHVAPKAAKRDTRLAARGKAKPGRAQASLTVTLAQRCKPRDRVRQCMAMLCREGKKSDPACEALSLLDH